MRGLLVRPPNTTDLERLYHELARRGAPAVGRASDWPYDLESDAHLLALAGDMLRYDPRLLSILLEWILKAWRTFDLIRVRQWMHRMRWPQALLVVLEFARQAERTDRELRYAIDYLGAGFAPLSPPERFFLGMDRPGSRRAQQRQHRTLAPYSRWGFLGVERPTADAFTKRTVGRYDASTRRRIARDLAARGPFTLSAYLDAVDNSITRQQARADLVAAGLKLEGHGRGARWSAS